MDPAIPANILEWLLDPIDPPVRYRALVDLLGRSPDDVEVQEAKAAIPESKAAVRIFSKMQPGGYWLHRGYGAGIGYAMSSSTHFVLSFLADLGLDRSDTRVEQAAERYLSLKEADVPNPAPWQIPPDTRNHQSCLYAYNLRTYARLGYRDDPRIRERLNVLVLDEHPDGGYLCDRASFYRSTKSCMRGSLKALMAYAEYPELWQTERCLQLVDYFLRRRLFYRMDDPTQLVRGEFTCLIFPFLIGGSLLELLLALSVMGYGRHPALDEAWALLENKRGPDGRFVREGGSETIFSVGAKGQPNRWVTLYAWLAVQQRDVAPPAPCVPPGAPDRRAES